EELEKDQYGRSIAVCMLGDEELNAWLVSEGWAVEKTLFVPPTVRKNFRHLPRSPCLIGDASLAGSQADDPAPQRPSDRLESEAGVRLQRGQKGTQL
ncbi:MAG: hypothetical protein GWN87_01465, partial [Desulfuromonadales bacterium]|nr:hypothetical protein [Desulfuromonadales bacterium]